MKCQQLVEMASATIDGRLPDAESQELRRHIKYCPECALYLHQLEKQRAALRSLARPLPPADLTTRLRVVASRHLAELDRRAEYCNTFTRWLNSWWMWGDNLIRPRALPAACGVLAALFLFGLMAPVFATHASIHDDVPTVLFTEASLARTFISFGQIPEDIVVDVYVDGSGRLIDYAVPSGQDWQNDPSLRRCIESVLLCTQFIPATMFGQPAAGRVRVTVRGNSVDVQG